MPFTQTALDEIELILDGALKYGGAEHARKVRNRFQRLFDHIDRGVGLGSARPDIGLGDEIRFVSTTPYPFLIVAIAGSGSCFGSSMPAATIGTW